MKSWLRRLNVVTIGALLLSIAFTIIAPAPSMASTTEDQFSRFCFDSTVICQNGVKLDVTGGGAFPEDSKCWEGYADPIPGNKVCIKTYGDYVYVRDFKAEGDSTVAEIIRQDGVGSSWWCRNKYGYDTWVKCNFDWPEGHSYDMWLWTFDAPTDRWTRYEYVGTFVD